MDTNYTFVYFAYNITSIKDSILNCHVLGQYNDHTYSTLCSIYFDHILLLTNRPLLRSLCLILSYIPHLLKVLKYRRMNSIEKAIKFALKILLQAASSFRSYFLLIRVRFQQNVNFPLACWTQKYFLLFSPLNWQEASRSCLQCCNIKSKEQYLKANFALIQLPQNNGNILMHDLRCSVNFWLDIFAPAFR